MSVKKLIPAAVLCLFVLGKTRLFAQQDATISLSEKTYPTYGFSDPSPVPLLNAVYPYFRFDGFTDQPVNKRWKVIILENAYLRLEILPEIGGKIWTAFDKKANRPFLYDNHTIKFRDIAMRGPWTSGGLESNFGIIGHTPNCATPVDYITEKNADGSVTCTIGALDLLTRCYWRLKINLPKDKAYFTTQGIWYNPTDITQPYYHWMNAGIPVKGQLEYAFPGNSYIGHNGEYASWPINQENGKDLSWYDNNDFGGPKSYHVFGKYTDFFGAYWHEPDFGMARYSLHSDKLGKKIWIWGLSRQGMIWEKLLTDTDGQYSEIQSGRLFNQTASASALTPFKHFGFAPEQTDTWTEYWFPVHATKGITEANNLGAFNFVHENHRWILHFSPITPLKDTLKMVVDGHVVYQKYLELSPLQPFSDSIPEPVSTHISLLLGKERFPAYLKNQQPDLQRPKDIPENTDWTSVFHLYQLGRNAIYEKDFPKANKLLTQALQKDSFFLPALNAMAELRLRSMDYLQASSLLKRALQVNTYDGEANYLWGIAQLAQGDTADALDGLDVASLTPGFRTKAFTEMAKIQIKQKQLSEAQAFLDKALSNNTNNIEALQLLLTTARLQQNKSVFEKEKQHLLALDPLNHYARFEDVRFHPSELLDNTFTRYIQNEMPHETFIEMAIWYHQLGLDEEATDLFMRCRRHPEAAYWLAYLADTTIDCSALDMDFAFPFRTETAQMLQALLQKQDDWQLKYSVALIEHHLGHISQSQMLLKSCSNQPGMAAFYAVRAAIGEDSILSNKATDLQRAIDIDGNWRYKKQLAEYDYERGDYQNGLHIAETYCKTHPADYIMGMLYARGLILQHRYKDCDKVLARIKVLPFEGATAAHELYREAKLMQAVAALHKGQLKETGSFVREACLWPENLGAGQPYEADMDRRLEYWLEYQNKRRNAKNADTVLLGKIIAFQPRTSNTIRNFFMENDLISAWAIEKMQGRDAALQWLDQQKKEDPGDKTLDAVIQCFRENSLAELPTQNVAGRVLKALHP